MRSNVQASRILVHGFCSLSCLGVSTITDLRDFVTIDDVLTTLHANGVLSRDILVLTLTLSVGMEIAAKHTGQMSSAECLHGGQIITVDNTTFLRVLD